MKPHNTLILQGNLTRDLEVRQNANGYTYGTTAIAVNERHQNEKGEWENKSTMFVDVYIKGEKAKYYEESYKKGRKVTLMGELNVNTYTNKNGEKKIGVSIKVDGSVLADMPKRDNSQYNGGNNQSNNNNYSPKEDFANQSFNPSEFEAMDDDGIPF